MPSSTADARNTVVLGAVLVLAVCAAVLAPLFTGGAPVNAQGDSVDEASCSGGGNPPTPMAVAVDAVPIVVDSTTADYFVLYVSHDLDGSTVDIPVLVKRGEAGTTTLAENVAALPVERYRVEKYLVTDPADVDGDCINDLTELDSLGSMNPLNPAAAIEITDGAVAIPDRATFEAFAHSSFTDESFVKFVLFGMDTDRPRVYFVNTKTYMQHEEFFDALSLDRAGTSSMTVGEVTYHRELVAPDGSQGVYRYWLRFTQGFDYAARAYTALAASMPLLTDNLAYHLPNHNLRGLQYSLHLYEESRINLVFDEDLGDESDFVSMNPAQGYGLLRVMGSGQRPNPRDIVIYDVLPNELPRVGGIITTVPQTPLSHVNLRAVQDGVPNAFIRDALDKPEIDALVGRFVHYTVTEDEYSISVADKAQVDHHYALSRPQATQTPQRDLSFTTITPLSEFGFDNWDAFGVKAANVAELRKLGFPAGTVPDGFAIPFYFYDEFMKHNGFYTRIGSMLASPTFQTNLDTQESELANLRAAIEAGETPQWMIDAIVTMNGELPEGINRRYRSSTNNEDLPGFNGAGLYDSKSQKPSEDEEDLAKSLKEVYASLWNFRAFVERDFHRVDHLAAAMGILVHPSYQDELANGVAVSFDPVYGDAEAYYINTQVGEDLVTNPEAHSVPEEVLIHRSGAYTTIIGTSNQVAPGQLIERGDHLAQLRQRLATIHDHFEGLYGPASDERFAMEIEFKVTSDGVLAIKQARPWVFSSASPPPAGITPLPTSITPPTGGGGGFAGGGGGGGPSGPSPSDEDFEWTGKRDIEELDSDHDLPAGAWSDGTTLWILENGDGADDAGYAYDLKTGERVEGREFALDERNRAPRGVWSDRSTIWVSDSGQNKLFAHDLGTGERLPERDIALAERNRDARGTWSDEVTMWVLDGVKDSLFAYDLASGELLAEYALDSANGDPHGIWSDGVTVWVSDHGEKRLFAYRLPEVPEAPAADDPGVTALERVRDEEFPNTVLSRASNNSPRGIWSDGDVMYVADASDGKVYTYNMPDAIDARLASLMLTGIEIGEFDGGRTEYEGVPGEGVTETTIEATTLQRRTSVAIAPVDADGDEANGHQVSLQGVSVVTVTVTSADGSRRGVYRVAFEPPVTELDLSPTWTSFEWPGAEGTAVADALRESGISDKVLAMYQWDETAQTWMGFFPGLEDVPGLTTLTSFQQGSSYWIAVTEPVSWVIPTSR